MEEHKSIKEFWAETGRDRRHAAGRRTTDYETCVHHEDIKRRCEDEMKTLWQKLEVMEERIIGKWTFGVIISILLAVITLATGASAVMFQSIKQDMKAFHDTLK